MSAYADFFSSHAPSFGHWLELSEIPLTGELTAVHPPKLPLNEFDERHQLKDQYLETQYRLHRYEATEPLRRAIQEYRAKFSYGNSDIELGLANIYKNVFVTGHALGNDGATQRLRICKPPNQLFIVDEAQEGEKVDEIEYLTPGTLLAVSTDHFRSTCSVAVVAENDGLQMDTPYIDVF
ncbi:hypothetical protein E4U57_002655 [Claviceps arundinis]|uniref:ZNFX1 domain-containing protein n=1 Tax=Claviceps arundinis TaxID=1623583 RepID=A0A9P7MX40_9HYPO|nr:hypothetical protein E4U57_002655 [Claviceps arundinis]KAG5973207.1 hypothetical protein E4U56_005199 [Claviceps arundinis]